MFINHLNYQNNKLIFDNCSLIDIAKKFETPSYVYSTQSIINAYEELKNAFTIPVDICYAIKASPNLSLLKLFHQLGAGFDIVSKGELQRLLLANGQANKTVFSGVGKSNDEIMFALAEGIRCFNIESASELKRIEAIAKTNNRIAPIALRINPNINAKTHPYITTGLHTSKFGLPINNELYELISWIQSSNHLNLTGLDCHIGSQITDHSCLIEAAEQLKKLALELNSTYNLNIKHLDLGGGFSIPYSTNESPFNLQAYAKEISALFKDTPFSIVLEPGRFLIGNAGILLTKAEYIKNQFLIVDAAMNDLIRPALYNATHTFYPLIESTLPSKKYQVVGPVCETADCLGTSSLNVQEGDYLAILSSGAYGFTQASNYNSRNRCAEILLHDGNSRLIRERESFLDQVALETTFLHQSF